jgi:hypothetical protein
MANLPGASSEPEIIAANVSMTTCLVFSTTASGSARRGASLMKVLIFEMIGPGGTAARATPSGPTPRTPSTVRLVSLVSMKALL